MNCDQAFDYLTDSARRDSGALARHLAQCARCRQLKDTLEPALDLFDELVPEPEIGSLERTRAAGDDSIRIAEQSAARLSRRRLLSASRIRSAASYAAVFLIGAALVYGLTIPGHPGDDPAPAGSICPWKNRTHADDANLSARQVVLSCVDCHMAPASPADNTSVLNLDSLRRSFALAMLSSDWFTPPPRDELFAAAVREASI